MRIHGFIALLLVSAAAGTSQSISGRLKDRTGAKLAYSPVALLNGKDSSIIKGVITDDSGAYSFNDLVPGKYSIGLSLNGYKKYKSKTLVLDSAAALSMADIVLEPEGLSLDEVNVTATKRTVEFKNGNITVNLEESPLAIGNSAYDILQRMPGVVILNNDISIQGRSGAKIMMDGKMEQVSGTQLISLLKSIRASSIDKIEIFKNPPVKLDAAGTAGIINIHTKKVKVRGFSGEINTEYSQGFYGVSTAALSLNYKGKKINLFSSITRTDESFHHTNKAFFETRLDTNLTRIDQRIEKKETGLYYPFNAGFDWYPTKKNTIGVKVSGYVGNSTEYDNGSSTINNTSLGYNELRWRMEAPNPWSYNDLNLNAEHLFDTTGTKLKFSSDYCSYFDIYDFNFDNRYLTNAIETVAPAIIRSRNTLNLEVLSAKIDYEKKINNMFSLETGLKGANQNISSKYKFEKQNTISGEFENDSTFSNNFTYNEKIMAGYFNFIGEIKKIKFQAGLRAENTDLATRSINANLLNSRKYFNLFPAINLEYKPSETHNLQISLNRRINRPDYNSLNPYRIFQNTLVSWGGNPFLRPEYSNSIEFSHTFRESVSNSFSFTKVDDVMVARFFLNDTTKVTRITQINLKDRQQFSYSFFMEKELGNRVTTNLKADASYLRYRGKLDSEDYSSSAFAWSATFNGTYLVAKNTKLETNVFYEGPWLNGIVSFKSRWYLDVGIRKTFYNDKLKLGLAAKDIFFTFYSRSRYQYQGQRIQGNAWEDSRRFNISLSYSFGKLKVQQRELISNEEEKARSGK